MKLFLDTANIAEIKAAAALGIIDGVTTNPSLVAKEKRPFEEIIKEIAGIVDGPISAEVVATDAAGMIAEAHPLAKIHSNIVIKVPMTAEGLKAVCALSKEQIATNVTLVFTPLQAMLAAKAGATYVSPFVGRLDDISHPGLQIIEDMVTVFGNYAFDTEILVASVRHPLHVLEAARLGADVATIPYKVLEQMISHPLTDIGIERFLSDWKKVTAG